MLQQNRHFLFYNTRILLSKTLTHLYMIFDFATNMYNIDNWNSVCWFLFSFFSLVILGYLSTIIISHYLCETFISYILCKVCMCMSFIHSQKFIKQTNPITFHEIIEHLIEKLPPKKFRAVYKNPYFFLFYPPIFIPISSKSTNESK